MLNNAIAILGGNLTQNKDGSYRTTKYAEENKKFKPFGDYIRIAAASYLYQDNSCPIIALGGRGVLLENIPDTPPVAQVIKDELVRQGVAEEDIITEQQSRNTFGQLVFLGKIIGKKKFSKVTIISNTYHLPRIRAMLDYNQDLQRLFQGIDVKIESAEEIAVAHEPAAWSNTVKSAYESETVKNLVKSEQQGVEQIQQGTYKFQ